MKNLILFLSLITSFIAKADILYTNQMDQNSLVIQTTKVGKKYRLLIDGHLIMQDSKGKKDIYFLLKEALEVIPPNQNFEVILNSPMGGAAAISLTAYFLFDQKCGQENKCQITTYIPASARCSSACISFFMLGDHRIAHESALFGFHALSDRGKKLSIEKSMDHYKFYGVPDKFLLKATKGGAFSSIDLSYFDPETLKNYAIIDEVIRD